MATESRKTYVGGEAMALLSLGAGYGWIQFPTSNMKFSVMGYVILIKGDQTNQNYIYILIYCFILNTLFDKNQVFLEALFFLS